MPRITIDKELAKRIAYMAIGLDIPRHKLVDEILREGIENLEKLTPYQLSMRNMHGNPPIGEYSE